MKNLKLQRNIKLNLFWHSLGANRQPRAGFASAATKISSYTAFFCVQTFICFFRDETCDSCGLPQKEGALSWWFNPWAEDGALQTLFNDPKVCESLLFSFKEATRNHWRQPQFLTEYAHGERFLQLKPLFELDPRTLVGGAFNLIFVSFLIFFLQHHTLIPSALSNTIQHGASLQLFSFYIRMTPSLLPMFQISYYYP
jgi:hypothetical protein